MKNLIIQRNDAITMHKDTYNALMQQIRETRNALQEKSSKLQEALKDGEWQFNEVEKHDSFMETISLEEVKNGKPTLEQIFIEMAELGL